jgi:hypothetical protein
MGIQAGSRTPTIENAGAPVDGTDEIQSLDITGVPTGGTFKVAFDGHISGDIAFDADAAAAELVIEAMPNIGVGGATVAGTNPNFGITFGANLAKLAVSEFTLYENLLTGGTTPSVTPSTDTPGVTATGRLAKTGTLLTDVTNGVLYINTGTALEPTWVVVGTQT